MCICKNWPSQSVTEQKNANSGNYPTKTKVLYEEIKCDKVYKERQTQNNKGRKQMAGQRYNTRILKEMGGNITTKGYFIAKSIM